MHVIWSEKSTYYASWHAFRFVLSVFNTREKQRHTDRQTDRQTDTYSRYRVVQIGRLVVSQTRSLRNWASSDHRPPSPGSCMSSVPTYTAVFSFPRVMTSHHQQVRAGNSTYIATHRDHQHQQLCSSSEDFVAKCFETYNIQGGAKNGASLSRCKYSENSTTELRGNWWTSAILYAEHSH